MREDLLDLLQKHNARLLLLFDYDGTLVPIAPTPDKARPDQELVRLLKALGRRYRVAIVSGRRLEEIQAFLPLSEIWGWAGCHGAEIKVAGKELWRYSLSSEEKALKDKFHLYLAQLLAGRKGFLLEDKGFVLALHYRLADKEEAKIVKEEARRAAETFLPRWQIRPGKKVLEFLPPGINKGAAVARLLAEAQGFLPAYFGDDAGDAPALRLVEEKAGIGVAVGSQAPPASFKLAGPEAVRQLLLRLCQP
ncbi:trehalose-phosphatase [Ammonifex thiophilus]|uniref:trehalose-phosphatase n=1 Tax=Ammonifex thiophilus TaxID=444093 RepID=UPI001403C1C3|nr:trehalose-phosphatase [Ammonifex thiophilus]